MPFTRPLRPCRSTSLTLRLMRLAQTRRSRSCKPVAKAYREALSRLREDTREWWQDVLADPDEDREPYSADAKGLVRFLQEEVGPWYENRRRELEQRPLIQSQAFGEALEPRRLEGDPITDVQPGV